MEPFIVRHPPPTGWIEVRLPNGVTGWIEADTAAEV